MVSSLRPEDVMAIIEKKAKEVEDERVYFTLRKMKLKYIKPATIEVIKRIIALDELGLPVTARFMSSLLKKPEQDMLEQLHILGDKHVLVLKRKTGRYYEWILSDIFKQHYYKVTQLCMEKQK